jgi:hypothetical protein
MTRLLTVTLAALCCCTALAAPVIDGSASDPLYPSTALAVQDTQTGYGDANLGRPDVCNGSEIDAAYGVVYGGKLYLVFAGNFETNNNKLNIFFDTRTGGQNRLLATNPGPDANGGLRRMSEVVGDPNLPGMTFQTGFAADYWVSVGCFGDPVGIFVDYAELYVDALNPGVFYFVGTGQAKCQTNGGALTPDPNAADPNALPAILVTIDNSNVAGVDGGFSFSNGSGVTTGIELAIPLSALGNPTGNIAITAFITDPVAANASNQFLGGIFAFVGTNLGETRAISLVGSPQTPFTVQNPPTAAVGACCHGTTCAIMTQAACTPGGGLYKGDNVSCDGNPCTPAFGRCCVDDGYAGQCYVVEDLAACTTLGGTFTANETCAGCPCLFLPNGACCNGTSCSVIREADCTAGGGTYVGNYTNCGSAPCDQGACCDGLTCTDTVYRFNCTGLLGFFAGAVCGSSPCAAPTIATPYLAGTFNGWTNPDPNYQMTETVPGNRIWTKLISGLLAGSRQEFKVTDGTWTHNLPAANSWFYADPNGECLVTYDSNFYSDGWAPARDRLGLSADPGAWNAPGDYVTGLGGLNWTNNDPHSAMVPQGGGVHKLTFTGVPAGNHVWKAVVSGTWDSISWDTRSVNTQNMAFTIGAPTDTVDLWVNNAIGVVKFDVTPGAPTGACCTPAGTCSVTTQVACTTPDTWLGAATTCSPNPCPQLGACCTPAGGCTQTLQAACLSPNIWHGELTTCTPNGCPQPPVTGACCSTTGVCSVITQAACTAAGGHYYGNNTVCRTGGGCPKTCKGDMNCDGRVTFVDIDLFVAALAGESHWTHWPCPWINADCNNTGTVNFVDIDPFVAVIGTTCLP